jgi:hypothetical protein
VHEARPPGPDLVDFLDAPLAENTDRGIAPSLGACADMLADDRVRALMITEFNPHHGSDDGETSRRLVDVLVHALVGAS